MRPIQPRINLKSKSTIISLALGILASVALGWWAGRGLEWDKVLDASKELSAAWILLTLAVFVFSNLCRAYRWQLLFVSERISIIRLFFIENIGLGVNSLLPVRIASEAVQFTLLTVRHNITGGTALATLGMTRIMDIWASTLLLALGLVLGLGGGQLGRYAAVALVVSLALLLLVIVLARGERGPAFLRRVKLISAFSSSVAELERNKVRLLASMLVSVGQWVCLGVCGWIVAQDMGIPLTLPQAVLVVLATIFFATTAPSLPAGIGTFEFAMITTMEVFFGVDKNAAFPYALVMHVLLFLPPMVFAGILLPREGITLFGILRMHQLRGDRHTPGGGASSPGGENRPDSQNRSRWPDEGLGSPRTD